MTQEAKNIFIREYLKENFKGYSADTYQAYAEKEDIADACNAAIEWADKQFNDEKKELLSLVKMLPINENNQTIIEDLIELLNY